MSMALGMMLTDGEEPRTGGPLTYDNYSKPGGISLPYMRKPLYIDEIETRTIRVDANGNVYDTIDTPRPDILVEATIPWTQPTHGPHIVPDAPESAPAPVKDPVMSPEMPSGAPVYTATGNAPGTDYKPLIIGGAIIAGLYFLSGK
jgi:hypothetical protein